MRAVLQQLEELQGKTGLAHKMFCKYRTKAFLEELYRKEIS
jgi:hypothetical protein